LRVSVILCTYNRCESLAKALKSISASILPGSVDWEVLIVDNNSKDQTRKVAESFCSSPDSHFRYIFEPQQGKSHALNTGIREAKGEILAFTDDDVEVETDWLENLTAPFRQGTWSGVSGRTFAEKSLVVPNWMGKDVQWWTAPLGLFDLGSEGHEISTTPFGNNMAFRAEMFTKYPGFRTDLGPRPGNEIRSEDTEFGRRLLEAGEKFWYEPSAVVYHATPENRVKKEYFLTWWHAKARGDVREFGIPSNSSWRVAGVPSDQILRFMVWTLRWITAVEPSRRFYSKVCTWSVMGTIQECYERSGRRNGSN